MKRALSNVVCCFMAFGLVGAAEAFLLMIGPLRVTGYAAALPFFYSPLINSAAVWLGSLPASCCIVERHIGLPRSGSQC